MSDVNVATAPTTHYINYDLFLNQVFESLRNLDGSLHTHWAETQELTFWLREIKTVRIGAYRQSGKTETIFRNFDPSADVLFSYNKNFKASFDLKCQRERNVDVSQRSLTLADLARKRRRGEFFSKVQIENLHTVKRIWVDDASFGDSLKLGTKTLYKELAPICNRETTIVMIG